MRSGLVRSVRGSMGRWEGRLLEGEGTILRCTYYIPKATDGRWCQQWFVVRLGFSLDEADVWPRH